MPKINDSTYAPLTAAATTGSEVLGPIEGTADGKTRNMTTLEVGKLPQKTITPWVAPTLINGWTNFLTAEGASGTVAGYCKVDATQELRLKGMIKPGTATQAMFVLPNGFRPAKTFTVTAHTYNTGTGNVTAAEVCISTDGTVVPYGTINAFISLDGISIPLN